MTPNHHPGDELLLAYVTAALVAPMQAAIAAHLTLCPACRDNAADLEAIGGSLFDGAAEDAGPLPTDDEIAALIARASATPDALPDPTVPPDDDDPSWHQHVPAPIRQLAGVGAGQLHWRRALPGVTFVDLATIAHDGAKARLVRTVAGGFLPSHVHRGLELTLVLGGGLSDQHGHFRRGDLLVVEPGISHRPVMDDDEDCLCFGVTDGAVIMNGMFDRIRQVITKY